VIVVQAKPKQPLKHNEKTILAVQRFINSRSWKEAKQLLEENKSVLLSKEADEVMAEMEEKYSRNIWGNEVWVIQEHRKLLAVSRKDGIDAAFTERIPKKNK
jgi:hypothetical protein